jgi:hypothetical protein
MWRKYPFTCSLIVITAIGFVANFVGVCFADSNEEIVGYGLAAFLFACSEFILSVSVGFMNASSETKETS